MACKQVQFIAIHIHCMLHAGVRNLHIVVAADAAQGRITTSSLLSTPCLIMLMHIKHLLLITAQVDAAHSIGMFSCCIRACCNGTFIYQAAFLRMRANILWPGGYVKRDLVQQYLHHMQLQALAAPGIETWRRLSL